jgi:hypothetical protein
MQVDRGSTVGQTDECVLNLCFTVAALSVWFSELAYIRTAELLANGLHRALCVVATVGFWVPIAMLCVSASIRGLRVTRRLPFEHGTRSVLVWSLHLGSWLFGALAINLIVVTLDQKIAFNLLQIIAQVVLLCSISMGTLATRASLSVHQVDQRALAVAIDQRSDIKVHLASVDEDSIQTDGSSSAPPHAVIEATKTDVTPEPRLLTLLSGWVFLTLALVPTVIGLAIVSDELEDSILAAPIFAANVLQLRATWAVRRWVIQSVGINQRQMRSSDPGPDVR